MPDLVPTPTPARSPALPGNAISSAAADIRIGRFEAQASVAVTPLALIAIGGLVAAILLSIPPIIRAAREPR